MPSLALRALASVNLRLGGTVAVQCEFHVAAITLCVISSNISLPSIVSQLIMSNIYNVIFLQFHDITKQNGRNSAGL